MSMMIHRAVMRQRKAMAKASQPVEENLVKSPKKKEQVETKPPVSSAKKGRKPKR